MRNALQALDDDDEKVELTTKQLQHRERQLACGDYAFYDYDSGISKFVKELVTFPKIELEDPKRFSHFDVPPSPAQGTWSNILPTGQPASQPASELASQPAGQPSSQPATQPPGRPNLVQASLAAST